MSVNFALQKSQQEDSMRPENCSHELDGTGPGVLRSVAAVPPSAGHSPRTSAAMRTLVVVSFITTAVLLSRQNVSAATVLWVGHCGNVAGYLTIQAAVNAASA